MLEKDCNLWDEPADAKCITTNGTVKKTGAAVMGRGCALEATWRFYNIQFVLGNRLALDGNTIHILIRDAKNTILSFPVKHNWWEKADLDLIKKSAETLIRITDAEGWEKVLIPRPGCGNGKLDWETEVKPILEPLLDDRFVVVSK